ncbi:MULTISPECIES: EamA family transporter [unclassified Delftia]|jgi:drug/metabolite transporter (DMT)-like permease|uniref:EamA family transporter n=1 Tax=unclassified Delftia TaxID=2613839 RepID=UPI00114E49CE|nr:MULTISPECIES: EamA family transporter [unclassified Delftia]MCB4784709.1 EamA family transporter [Delftia sp. Lp-1]TQL65830.1 EamA-like transporter family protein [Delftia sp. HK171]
MTPFLTSITILCVLGISLGQMLFKKAALSMPEAATWQHWVFNGWLITALALYGITTLVWIWVLRHAPLHLAYPFMGLAFVIVPCLGWLFLNEPIRIPTLVGGALILAGITITAHAS